MIHLLLVVGIWASLTIVFMVRFRNIMINLSDCITPGEGLLKVPSFDLGPVKQAMAWVAELFVLITFYDLFGVAVSAHLVASVCACALMFMMRDRKAPDFLHAIQLLPDNQALPVWLDWTHQEACAVAA